MKNRGAVRVFTILLSVICLYYLSFSLVTWNVERKAEEVAERRAGDNLAKVDSFERRYLDSMAGVEVYPVFGFSYDEAKGKQLNLGLDLQGGMHVTIELAVDRLIKRLSGVENNTESMELLEKSLAAAKQKQRTSQEDYVSLFYESFQEQAGGKSLFQVFDTRSNQGKFERNAENPDQEVLKYIREEAESAIARTTNILRTRIDKFGVTQPNIREEGGGRITIELPGADEPDRVRDIIQKSAKLSFWETYSAVELYGEGGFFGDVNEVLINKLGVGDSSATDSAGKPAENPLEAGNTDSVSQDNPLVQADDNPLETDGDDDALESPLESDDNIDSNDLSESSDAQDSLNPLAEAAEDTAGQDTTQQAASDVASPLFKVLSPPVDQQNQVMQGPIAGFALSRDTTLVNEYLNYPEVRAAMPKNIRFKWTAIAQQGESGDFYTLVALKAAQNGKASLDGKVVVDAGLQFNPNGKPGVQMRMNAEGANAWRKLTGSNVGKSVAIVLDGNVYSYPTVQGEISGGVSSIDGQFSIDEAKDLANILKAGKLPISVDIVEEAVVGPTLGEKSIQDGLTSLLIGFILVLVFMALYYNRAGWVANLALLANLFFIIGTLASVQAALTLPGMAGIVLTIGMSVDANVLIFERIREELKAGKGVKQAVADGYRNALTSIVDANVTTLLTAIILYVFGKGPIAGFGVILLIGIVTSFFCAVFLSRLIFLGLLDRDKTIKFGSKGTMNLLSTINFDFISKRKIAYIVSGIIIAGGVVSLMTKGLNLSVDFQGGRSYQVQTEKVVNVSDIRTKLTDVFESQPEVKTFGADNIYKITTKYAINNDDDGIDKKVQDMLEGGLTDVVGADMFEVLSVNKVGPTFARDIKIAAIWSVLISLIFIFLYIVIRFRKWQYGLGALAALFHDVLVVLGIFSIFWGILPFNLEIDQAFIAAILTVVGYSINDTVVVFDRIRENLALHTRMSTVNVINGALNKTISRTFITSITTLLVVGVLFATGGEIIRGFSFALLIGVLVGTYSSLFIATPIVVDFGKKREDREVDTEEKTTTEVEA